MEDDEDDVIIAAGEELFLIIGDGVGVEVIATEALDADDMMMCVVHT